MFCTLLAYFCTILICKLLYKPSDCAVCQTRACSTCKYVCTCFVVFHYCLHSLLYVSHYFCVHQKLRNDIVDVSLHTHRKSCQRESRKIRSAWQGTVYTVYVQCMQVMCLFLCLVYVGLVYDADLGRKHVPLQLETQLVVQQHCTVCYSMCL